jgi:hypothetical protein
MELQIRQAVDHWRSSDSPFFLNFTNDMWLTQQETGVQRSNFWVHYLTDRDRIKFLCVEACKRAVDFNFVG